MISLTRRQSSSSATFAATTRPTLQTQQSMTSLPQNPTNTKSVSLSSSITGFFGGLGGMAHSMAMQNKESLKEKENLNNRPVLTNITNKQQTTMNNQSQQMMMKSSISQQQKPSCPVPAPAPTLVRRISSSTNGTETKTEEEIVELLTRLQSIPHEEQDPNFQSAIRLSLGSTCSSASDIENDFESNNNMEITQSVVEETQQDHWDEPEPKEQIKDDSLDMQPSCQNTSTPQKQQESLGNANSWNVIQMMKSPGIDTNYTDQPKHMSEIVKEIISNMKESESKYSVPEGWLEKESPYFQQNFANYKMISPYAREKLVDEVLKFCYESGFTTPTIFLAIDYLDRFIYNNPKKFTTDTEVFTAGLVCGWIAAKYEEIHPPSAGNVSANYKLKKITFLDMELQILSALGYNCTISTTYPFLKRFLHTDLASMPVTQVAFFLSQMTLMYSHFSSMKPSKLAGAALYVARMVMNETNSTSSNLSANGNSKNFSSFFGTSYALKCPNTNFEADPKYWSNHAEYYTGYELKEIFPEICAILKMLSEYERTPKSRVITTVFSDKKKGYACLRVRNFMRAKGMTFGF